MLRLSVAVCLLLIIGAGFFYWTTTPTYSLIQLSKAIDEHDRDGVEKYLDLESVANDVMDQVFDSLPEVKNTENQRSPVGQMVARGFLEILKPNLAAIAKEKFLKFVESGAFEEAANDADPGAQVSVALRRVMETEFQQIVRVEEDGKIAKVTLKLRTARGLQIFPELRLRDRRGYWQIVGINNVSQILEENEETRVASEVAQ